MIHGDVLGRETVDGDVVEAYAHLMFGVDSQHRGVAGRDAVDVLEHDIAVDRNQVPGKDGVHRVQHDGIGHVLHADVLVRDIFDKAAAAAVGLDANAVVGAFQ